MSQILTSIGPRFLESCIVCGSDNGLDTELTITINNTKISVKLCTDHSEDTTPKIAKAAYLERKSDADKVMSDFLAQATKLGMVVVPQGNPETAVKPAGPRSAELQGGKNEGILPTSVVDNVMQNRVAGLSGAGVEGYTFFKPDELTDQLPDGARDGLVKMQLVEGRQGTPLAIPAVRQDGLGTTRVSVGKSMSDAELQRRFKQLAARDHSFGQEGYDLHRCIMCKGDGQIAKSQNETIICPKCGGSGLA